MYVCTYVMCIWAVQNDVTQIWSLFDPPPPLSTHCHKILPPPLPLFCFVFFSVILQFFCSLLLSALHLFIFLQLIPCSIAFFLHVILFCQATPSPKQYKTFCTTRVCPSLHKDKHSSRESKCTYVIYFLIKTNDTATSTNILF